MKFSWQSIKTALRLSAAAVAVCAGIVVIAGAWIEARASDAALLYWNFSERESASELRDMWWGMAVVAALFAVWGFIKIRDWVLASPKVKRALSLSALLGWSLVGGLFAYVGVLGLLSASNYGFAATCLANCALVIGLVVIEMRRWRRAGRMA